VHVTQEDGGATWTLQTENVRRFALTADARAAAVVRVILDGQTDLPLVRAPQGHYCRLGATGSAWVVCADDERGAWALTERSPASSGPVLQVWDRPALVVVGTVGADGDLAAVYLAAASMLASDYYHYALGRAQVVMDIEALERNDLGDYHLILLGGPPTNAVAASLAAALPGARPAE
jgi:hypothetical protein